MSGSPITRHVRTLIAVAGVFTIVGAASARAQGQAIDPKWLGFDAAARTARFQLIAGLTGLNGALNFNGYSDGGLTFVVPLGWQIEIDFRNHDGMLPHSAEIIKPTTPPPVQSVAPWTRGWCRRRRTRCGSRRNPRGTI